MSQMMIVTDSFLKKLHNQREHEHNNFSMFVRIVKRGPLIIFAKDVGRLLSDTRCFADKIMSPKFCLMEYKDNISEENFDYAFKAAEVSPEKIIFISTDKRNFSISNKVGIKKNYYFTEKEVRYANNKFQPYEVLDRIETLLTIM